MDSHHSPALTSSCIYEQLPGACKSGCKMSTFASLSSSISSVGWLLCDRLKSSRALFGKCMHSSAALSEYRSIQVVSSGHAEVDVWVEGPGWVMIGVVIAWISSEIKGRLKKCDMAAPDSGISVVVVDGQLGALHKLGFALWSQLECQKIHCRAVSVSILAHQPSWCYKCG